MIEGPVRRLLLPVRLLLLLLLLLLSLCACGGGMRGSDGNEWRG